MTTDSEVREAFYSWCPKDDIGLSLFDVWKAAVEWLQTRPPSPSPAGAVPFCSAADRIAPTTFDDRFVVREDHASAEPAPAVAVPDGWRLVPRDFVSRVLALAHNWSMVADPPEYYRGVEADAFREAYRRCGKDLAEARELLAASPPSAATGKGEGG